MRVRKLGEIIESEQEYVRCLTAAHEVCLEPLLDIVFRPVQEKEMRLLPDSIHIVDMLTTGSNLRLTKACDEAKSTQVTVAINSLKHILVLHRRFLADLLKAQQAGGEGDWNCGKAFIKLVPMLRIYELYSASCDNLMQLLAPNGAFHDVIEYWQQDPRSQWLRVDSLLIKPIQRPVQYGLLLKDLLECTPDGHADREVLEEAKKELTVLSSYLDQATRSG